MKFLKDNIWTLVILIVGLVGIYFIDRNNIRTQEKEAEFELQAAHGLVQNQIANAVEEFAATVSGMRSYINLSEEFPTAEQFQNFVQNQFRGMNSKDSIVVSYINAEHVFIYSFTRKEMDPAQLVGTSVSDIRSQDKINLLDHLLDTDSLRLFPPINLFEGWTGIPINFRVNRNDSVKGYVAPILNFKTLIADVYNTEQNKGFVFHFNFDNKFDFDREMVYNGTKSYNSKKDSEYYKNFDVPSEDFIYSEIKKYGASIRVGTAFKNKIIKRSSFIWWLLMAHLLLVLLLYLLNRQISMSKLLNHQLHVSNLALADKTSEYAKQNEELTQLNLTKDKFFSIVGHDIKQPLNSVVGLVDLLSQEEIKDQSLKSIINSLKGSALSTSELLSNLLKWAKSQTGDIDFVLVNCSINELTEDQISYLKSQAEAKDIAIRFVPQKQIYAAVDANMLASVIRNLVSNAIKFSKPKEEVVVTLGTNEANFVLTVKDKGVGMTENEIKNFFDIKTQVSKMGTSGEAGTGLGLMLCQTFVKTHNGTIDLTSDQLKGTEFRISIPLRQSYTSASTKSVTT